MAPRSILKRAVVSTSTHTHAVHFPPSPSLCRTFDAYPPTMYDRTPIVVDKNNCALPERGCPGRTYVLEEQYLSRNQAPSPGSRGYNASSRSYHPRALNNNSSATQYRASHADLPQLIPDMSSESDESDGFSSSPHASDDLYSYGSHGLSAKYESYDYQPCKSIPNSNVNTLAFLPHPPTPPPNYHTTEHVQATKSRRRRSPSRRRHDSAAEPERIRSDSAPKSSFSSRRRELLLASYSGFGARDDGCLGGF